MIRLAEKAAESSRVAQDSSPWRWAFPLRLKTQDLHLSRDGRGFGAFSKEIATREAMGVRAT